MSRIILFDLPSRDPCKCWSLNPWKTRLLLNYKNIPYETKWVEYPDIKPLLKDHIPPNAQGAMAEYTIPAVLFPDGTYLQDSRVIADRIEKDYPNPPVNLTSPVLKEVESLLPKINDPLRPVFVPKVPTRLLNEASWPHWYTTREKRFGGMKLDQVEKELGGDSAWVEVVSPLHQVTKLLTATDGPFFSEDGVSYVDFVWAGYLRFMQRIGDDVFDKLLESSGDAEAHRAQLKACEPWLARDDH